MVVHGALVLWKIVLFFQGIRSVLLFVWERILNYRVLSILRGRGENRISNQFIFSTQEKWAKCSKFIA